MDPIQNRRSSILKPQKPRNPLSDLDIIEPDEDDSPVASNVTRRSSMRRVSFASSNFIKQFVTDPEKNTIWDSTYEETANRSDSAHGSGINETDGTSSSSGTKCKASISVQEQHEQFVQDSSSLGGIVYGCEEQIIEKQIVQTSGLNIVSKSVAVTSFSVTQQKSVVKTEEKLSLVLSSEERNKDLNDKENVPISNLLAGDKENLVLPRSKNICNLENKTLMREDSMDISLSPASCAGPTDETAMEVVSMELTQSALIFNTDERDVKNKTVVDDALVEFTQLVPVVNMESFAGKTKTDSDRQTYSVKNQTVMDTDMEFTSLIKNGSEAGNMFTMKDKSMVTAEIHQFLDITKGIAIDGKMEHSQLNQISKDSKIMPGTQQFPVFGNHSHSVKHKTGVDTHMQQTCHTGNISAMKDQSTTGRKGMDGTQRIPVAGNQSYGVKNKTVMDIDMELSLGVPSIQKTCDARNISTMKDKSTTGRHAMESTQQIPVAGNPSYGVKNKTVMDTDMELSLGVLSIQQTCHTRNISTMKDQSTTGRQGMDGTQRIPVAGNQSYGVKNKTVMDTDMELSLGVPSIQKTCDAKNISTMKDKSTTGRHAMESTQQIPVAGNQSYGVKNKTVMDTDMELSLGVLGIQKTCDARNISTMSDKSTIGRDAMEFLQHIPVIDKISGNMEPSQLREIPNNSSGEAADPSGSKINADTQQLPVFGNQPYGPEDKTVMDSDMQLSLETPGIQQTCHTGNISEMKDKSTTGRQGMDGIQQILVAGNQSYGVKNKTVRDTDMELSLGVPSIQKNEIPKKSSFKIKCGKQQISAAGIQKSCDTTKDKSTISRQALEFTQEILSIDENSHGITKGTVIDGKMKLAQLNQLPEKSSGEARGTSIKFGNQQMAVESSGFIQKGYDTTNTSIMKDKSTIAGQVREFTPQIFVVMDANKELTRQCSFLDKPQETSAMQNRTQQTPVVDRNSCSVKNKEEETSHINKSAIDGAAKVFISQIPDVDKQGYGVKNETQQPPVFAQVSFVQKATMELSQLIPTDYQKSSDTSSTSTTSTNLKTESAHQIPVIVVEMTKRPADLELSPRPIFKKASYNASGTSRMKNICTLSSAPQQIPAIDVGVLQALQSPVVTTSTQGVKNESAVGGTGMEFTPQRQLGKTKDGRDTPASSNSKNTFAMRDAFLKSTQQTPLVGKTHEFADLLDDKQESTQPHPGCDTTSPSGKKNKAGGVEGHMENFQKIPPACATTHSIQRMDLSKVEAVEEPPEDFLAIKNLSLTNPDVEDPNRLDIPNAMKPDNLPLNEPDANCTVLKTPGSSFHMCSTPYSTSIDDTRHLVNYSCSSNQPKSDFSRLIQGSLNYTPLSNKFMHLSEFSTNAFPVSLETTRNNQTNIECDHDDKECKVQLEGCKKLKRPSLENIEDAVVCKKPMLDDTEPRGTGLFEEEKMEMSLLDISAPHQMTNISQYDNSFPGQDIKDIIHSYASVSRRSLANTTNQPSEEYSKNWAAHLKTTETMENKLRSFREKMVQRGIETAKLSEQLEEQLREEMAEMKRPFKPPIREKFSNDSSSECSYLGSMDGPDDMAWEETELPFCTDGEVVDVPDRVLSLEEKIEEKRKRCKRYWNVLSMEDGKYVFETLFKTIQLAVKVAKDTAIVETIDVHNNVPETAEPQAKFVHAIFTKRLAERVIQAAVGEHYDVLTLLDYIHMNMQEMMGILKELDSFTIRYGLEMDENFRVTFSLISLPLRTAWYISVDMADLENITEDSVHAFATVGSVKEADIKSFVANCLRGTMFLKNFISNVVGYVELLKKRKKTLMKSKAIR